MCRPSYPGTWYTLRLDSEELDVEVEGGVGRDDATCSTAAVPQLRRYRDLTPLADLRNRAGNAIDADAETDNEVCSVTAVLQKPTLYRRASSTYRIMHFTWHKLRNTIERRPGRRTILIAMRRSHSNQTFGDREKGVETAVVRARGATYLQHAMRPGLLSELAHYQVKYNTRRLSPTIIQRAHIHKTRVSHDRTQDRLALRASRLVVLDILRALT